MLEQLYVQSCVYRGKPNQYKNNYESKISTCYVLKSVIECLTACTVEDSSFIPKVGTI